MTALLSALGTLAWFGMLGLGGYCIVRLIAWASPSDPGEDDTDD